MFKYILCISCFIYCHLCYGQLEKREMFSAHDQNEIDSLTQLLKTGDQSITIENRVELLRRRRVLSRLKYSLRQKRFDEVRDSLFTKGDIQLDSLKLFFEHSIWIENDPYSQVAFERLWENESCKLYLIEIADFSVSYGYEEQLPVASLLWDFVRKEDFKYAIEYMKIESEYRSSISLHIFSPLYSKSEYELLLTDEILIIPHLSSDIITEIRDFFF